MGISQRHTLCISFLIVALLLRLLLLLPPPLLLLQRDVPGLTRAVIPVLAAKGIKAVSVGVNPGAALAFFELQCSISWVFSGTNSPSTAHISLVYLCCLAHTAPVVLHRVTKMSLDTTTCGNMTCMTLDIAVVMHMPAGSAPPGVPMFTPFIWRDEASGTQLLAFWRPGGGSLLRFDSMTLLHVMKGCN
jgi:hypothetical protein